VKYLIAGLGNPGEGYAGNRHNVGSRCVSLLARRHAIPLKAGRRASEGKGRIGDAEVVLLRPRTYVNRSGDAIGPVFRREALALPDLIVVYDELDLPVGRLRLRPHGGTAGHNGLKSIASAVGGSGFGRVRIGIGRPLVEGEPSWDPEAVADYVLADPPKAERELIDAALERAVEAIEFVLAEGFAAAMNRYNSR
jgi:PTH1 family peptidyl-tRNA hydrolase